MYATKEDLQRAEERILAAVRSMIRESQRQTSDALADAKEDICDAVYAQVSTDVSSRALTTTNSSAITKMHKEIVSELRAEFVPVIANIATKLEYYTEDSAAAVENYRRAVVSRSAPKRAITDGTADSRQISEYVSTVFGEGD